MKLLISKILQRATFIFLRDLFNIKPMHGSIDHLKNSASVSDIFLWRTDNNFKTIFRYTDILKLFYKIDESEVEFHFYDKNNNFIKKKIINNLKLSNELIIDKDLLNGIEDYGVFYAFHKPKKKIKEKIIISCREFVGFSYNDNLYSYVHGNILVKSKNFEDGKETIKTARASNFQRYRYC